MHAEIEGRDVTVMDHRSYEYSVTVYRLIIGTEVLKKAGYMVRILGLAAFFPTRLLDGKSICNQCKQ